MILTALLVECFSGELKLKPGSGRYFITDFDGAFLEGVFTFIAPF
jgi:hypothetical protein